MNRDEHLRWCKDRALEYVKVGDAKQAIASFMSDMSKHSETENRVALQLMAMMLFSGLLSTPKQVEDFILGFN